MNALRLFFVSAVALVLGAMPITSLAHNDPSITASDNALNHLVEEVEPAVYTITTNFILRKKGSEKTVGNASGSGTAFGVTSSGLVITALHVVRPPDIEDAPLSYVAPRTWRHKNGMNADANYELTTTNGRSYKGEIVAIDEENDLAILSIAKPASKERFPFLHFKKTPPKYDRVIAIGAPFGFNFSVSEGIVSAPARKINGFGDRVFLQTDAAINPGNSGGPLILLRDHLVVGVAIQIFSRSGDNIGIGFAIPAPVAEKFLEETLRKRGESR